MELTKYATGHDIQCIASDLSLSTTTQPMKTSARIHVIYAWTVKAFKDYKKLKALSLSSFATINCRLVFIPA